MKISALSLALCALLLAVMPVRAQNECATAYSNNDWKAAHQACLPLAEQGDADAQNNLGVMYRYGEGVVRNYVQAAHWWRQAAEQGYAPAQNNLGMMYHYGEGVPRDYTQAMRWYRRAAEQGDAEAQYGLGVMYANGEGVRINDIVAYKWFSLAEAQGLRNASEFINLLDGHMTPGQIAEAQKQAAEWLEAHPNPAE